MEQSYLRNFPRDVLIYLAQVALGPEELFLLSCCCKELFQICTTARTMKPYATHNIKQYAFKCGSLELIHFSKQYRRFYNPVEDSLCWSLLCQYGHWDVFNHLVQDKAFDIRLYSAALEGAARGHQMDIFVELLNVVEKRFKAEVVESLFRDSGKDFLEAAVESGSHEMVTMLTDLRYSTQLKNEGQRMLIGASKCLTTTSMLDWCHSTLAILTESSIDVCSTTAATVGAVNNLEWLWTKFPALMSGRISKILSAGIAHENVLRWLTKKIATDRRYEIVPFVTVGSGLGKTLMPYPVLRCLVDLHRINAHFKDKSNHEMTEKELQQFLATPQQLPLPIFTDDTELTKSWCVQAVQRGQINELKILVANGARLTARVCEEAARTNRLDILKWLRAEALCPWDWTTKAAAVRRNDPTMLKWLQQNPCPEPPWFILELTQNFGSV